MRNILLLTLFWVATLALPAHAQCTAYPYNLTNGTTADASQVMGNFNYVGGCAASTTSPTITGPATFNAPNGTNSVGVVAIAPLSGTGEAIYATATDGGTYAIVANAAGASVTALLAEGSGPSETALYAEGPAVGTGSWIVNSDERLKKNIQQITDAVSLVERLRGVRYQWRTPTERTVGKTMNLPENQPQIGFVAQEVQSVVPEAVAARKSGAEEILGVANGTLIPVLVEAIKEQQAEIEQLRAAVASLKSAAPAAR